MRKSGHVSLYISDFRSLLSRIGDWGERAYINVYRRGLESRLLDQLALHPGTFETIQELMDVTLKLDTRYHERQKEKGGNQKKQPPATGSYQSRPPHSSYLKSPHQKNKKKESNFHLQRTSPMLLSSIRTRNQLVLKRRGESKRGCVIIVVESTQLKNASKDLRTILGHQGASLASREKPYWGS
ncbi:hypothetical protein O181_046880 [Austropuccinia psidii MF-1]|uniref:Uncharacterized protein n=1 Tax=Austropuccinia psidii MF-1 TaxID=1389203 RepID=A0A9Q3DPA4_9BASI|nr:hypothetical protein [Austropuccinia psidii MF-1]